MVQNVETRWILMRGPTQRIMEEYKVLLVKVGIDMIGGSGQKSVVGAVAIFDVLVDVEVLLSLACFILLLNAVHCLNKLSQSRDIFVCDFVQAMKLCQQELARLFIDKTTTFGRVEFRSYNALVVLESKDFPLVWKKDPANLGTLYLLYNFDFTGIFARCHDKQTGEHKFVTAKEYQRLKDNVKRQFSEIAQNMVNELDRRFPQHDLLDAFGIIYPQYWRQEGAEETFGAHLAVLKSFYAHPATLKQGQPEGKPYTAAELLFATKLNNQQGLFKVTMRAHCEAACGSPYTINHVVKLWQKLSQSRPLR